MTLAARPKERTRVLEQEGVSSSVDLPAPFGPTTAGERPGANPRVTGAHTDVPP